MNDLILSKMREGDWGEVVRLMREEYGSSQAASKSEPPGEMPFRERFETVRVTPLKVADSVVEENGRFAGIIFEGEQYKPSQRFLKGLARRMRVSLSVFELFSPLEVVRRAAERAPDLSLRVTLDRQEHQALGLIEDKGVPIPAGNIEMTHIWQFEKGQRGGHGKGFRNEMLRLGIDEAEQRLRDGSPADRIGREAEMRYPQLTARLRECLTSPHRSSKSTDFAFFRLMLG